MRGIRVWARLLGLALAVVEDVFVDGAAVVVAVRSRSRDRCPSVGGAAQAMTSARAGGAGAGSGHDQGFVEAEAARVQCPRNGAIVAAAPWARHDSALPARLRTGGVAGRQRVGDGSGAADAHDVADGRLDLPRVAADARAQRAHPTGQPAPIPRLPAREQLRQIYRLDTDHGTRPPRGLAELGLEMRDQRSAVKAALGHRLSNARTERIKTQIRLISRRGFGYHSRDAVIAPGMLSLGGSARPCPAGYDHGPGRRF